MQGVSHTRVYPLLVAKVAPGQGMTKHQVLLKPGCLHTAAAALAQLSRVLGFYTLELYELLP